MRNLLPTVSDSSAIFLIVHLRMNNFQGFHPSVHDLSGASSSAQHSSSTPDNHPLVLGGAPPLTAGGTQASIPLTAVSSPSGSSSAGGQRLDSTPHSVETPNQLLNTQQTSVDNISDAGCCVHIAGADAYDSEQDFYQTHGNQHPLDPPQQSSQQMTSITDERKNITAKKRGIFPKPATNIMRAWLFHHLTLLTPSVVIRATFWALASGDESLSMCGSLNEDGGRESVLSDGQTTTNGSKRKVPKVFSKEAITKFRAWLFQNLTVRFVFAHFISSH
uniref:MEIS N-terminal domain-containing protein n=1 Tax=Ascaris lumbricoides TaxID=6252 RepID=A0A9J2Q545_ASCLU